MNAENSVIFKGTKDGITLHLDPDTDFEVLKDALKNKLVDSSKFFDSVKTSIILRGKILTEEQEIEILKIISDSTNMDISFVHSNPELEITLATLISDEMKSCSITKFHKGNMRSGQSIDFKGSVVVLGDVNPGAIVCAEANIIILGALKGIAHAGSKGKTDCFVAALQMMPVQLRIADIITRFPDDEKKAKISPEYAYIDNGQIFVSPLG
ncbi:MAG: septum site-determining protein MinC [Lachnospiraceae bacterium]|nr:septum site-determining protein MinC [Lachnospiraceae bacterium]